MGDNLLLPHLTNKHEVDEVIRNTQNLVVVLRFGRSEELECMQLDHIVSYNFMQWEKLYQNFYRKFLDCM